MNLTVEEASKISGMSLQFIRIGLQRGILPFGYAIKMTGNRYTYHISKRKFEEYIGGTDDEKCIMQQGSDK